MNPQSQYDDDAAAADADAVDDDDQDHGDVDDDKMAMVVIMLMVLLMVMMMVLILIMSNVQYMALADQLDHHPNRQNQHQHHNCQHSPWHQKIGQGLPKTSDRVQSLQHCHGHHDDGHGDACD